MKKTLAFLTLIFMLIIPANSVFAASGVYDDAGLFYETEVIALQEELTSLTEATGWDAAVVTTDDAKGKTSMAYADDFYTELGYGDNGVLYLVDMDNREIYISATGTASECLTDIRMDNIFDSAVSYASQGSFYKAVSTEISMSLEYFQAGIPVDSDKAAVHIAVIVTGIIIGAALAAFWVITVYKEYSFEEIGEIYEYTSKSKVNFNVKDDKLVNSFITTRIRPRQRKNPPSGGRSRNSSAHRASSGRVHTGRGRKF